MAMKPFKDWSFAELVDYCAAEILKDLISGNFRGGVYMALDTALRWDRESRKKPKKK